MTRYKSLFRNVSLAYLILIAIANFLPLNSTSISFGEPVFKNYKSEHLLHAIAYFPVGFFIFILLYDVFSRNSSRLIVAALYSLLFGLLTECAQYFLPYRAFSLNDLTANLIGVLLGFVFIFFFLKLKTGHSLP